MTFKINYDKKHRFITTKVILGHTEEFTKCPGPVFPKLFRFRIKTRLKFQNE